MENSISDYPRRIASSHIILENAPIGISKIIDRKQVLVNQKTVDLFQYSKEEMEFQTTRKLYTSDEAYEKLGRDAYPVLSQGLTYETVQELLRKDGTHLFVRYIGKAVEPPDMSKGTIWLVEDITARKQAEEILIYERNLSMDILNAHLSGIYRIRVSAPKTWEKDAWRSSKLSPHVIELASEAFCKILGTTKEAFENNPGMIIDLIYPDDREGFAKKNEEAAVNLEEFFWEGRILIDGVIRWVRFQSLPRPIENGDVLWTGSLIDITERKRADDALINSEAKYRQLVNDMPGIIYSFDLEQGGAYYSPAVESVLGYSSEYLLEHPLCWHDSIHPDDLPKVESAIESFKAGVPFNIEYRFHHADGHWIWIDDRSTDLTKAGVNATRIEGIATEVTIRKQMEEMLINSRQKLASIIDGTRAGTWEWNVQTGETVFNEQWAGIIGYSLDEISPVSIETWMKFAHPDDLQKSGELLEKHFLRELDYYEHESRMKHKSGRWVWVLDRGKVASWTDDGKPLWMYGTHQDITSRKKLENELVKIMEVSPSGIWRTDSAGLNTYVSESWSKITGISAEMAVGHGWSTALHPDDRERVFNEWHITAISDAKLYQSEFRFLRGDGSVVWVLCLSVAITDDENRTLEWVGSISDITNLKDTEIQLQEAKTAAESANTTKSQFLANMSHEIRTPMNGVLGMTQLLEMTELTAEQREYVAALKLSGKNLLSLISDILDLSKIEAGKIILESAEFSLHQSINDIVLMQKSVAFEKRLALELNLAKDIPPLLVGDQLRIKQILLNLLGNAIKFTSQGGVAISTQLLEQQDNFALIQIAVRDSGIGASPESLNTIFKPFTQEDGSISRKFGGTGLGLTISLRLAELMGGTIGVESTPGVGSCFTLTLPFTVGRAAATIQPAPSTITTAGWDGPPLRILFVEDDQVNIKFGSLLLKKMGLDVVVVENGRECLNALEQSTFDLVLMDIQMPVMTGEEALKEIRRKEQGTTKHQPVIALTAYSMRGDMERFMGEGFDGYVSKPLITRELMGEMKRVMGISGEAMEEIYGYACSKT